jgi:hypothetical protein
MLALMSGMPRSNSTSSASTPPRAAGEASAWARNAATIDPVSIAPRGTSDRGMN